MEALLTPEQTGTLVDKTPLALALDRHRRKGLPYVRMGKRIFYRRDAVEEFIRKNSFNGDGTSMEKRPKRARRRRAGSVNFEK